MTGLLWAALAAPSLQAQEAYYGQSPAGLDVQLFSPALDGQGTLWVNDSLRAPQGQTLARVLMHRSHEPLTYLRNDGVETPLVDGLWQLDVVAAHTRGPLRVGLQLPVFVRASSALLPAQSGLGDVALEAKWSAVDRRQAPVGLAVLGRLRAPTSGMALPLGAAGLTWEAQLIADAALGRRVSAAANLGARGVPEVPMENLNWGNALLFRGGVGYALRPNSLGLSLEAAGQAPLSELSNPDALALEALAGAWWRVDQNWVLRGGVGAGVLGGIGAAESRVMLGVGWEPSWVPMDADFDGVPDEVDACPQIPEDLDGVVDLDGCPEGTWLTIVLRDADGQNLESMELVLDGEKGQSGVPQEIQAGQLTLEARLPGYVPLHTALDVPNTEQVALEVVLVQLATLSLEIRDPEGQAIPQARWTVDAVTSGEAERSLEPGAHEIRVEAEGFRPLQTRLSLEPGEILVHQVVLEPAKVALTQEAIEIRESIFFETGQAVIKTESHPLLDEVAEMMLAHPELTQVRVEGHTDSRGSAPDNLALSQARAEAVRDHLVNAGVDPARLLAEGFGESRPLDPRDGAEAWAKNRRVDFVVLQTQTEATDTVVAPPSADP